MIRPDVPKASTMGCGGCQAHSPSPLRWLGAGHPNGGSAETSQWSRKGPTGAMWGFYFFCKIVLSIIKLHTGV